MVLPTVRESDTSEEVPAPQGQPEGSCRGLPGAEEQTSSIQLQQETQAWQPKVSSVNQALVRWPQIGGQVVQEALPSPCLHHQTPLPRTGESTRAQGDPVLQWLHWFLCHHFPQWRASGVRGLAIHEPKGTVRT